LLIGCFHLLEHVPIECDRCRIGVVRLSIGHLNIEIGQNVKSRPPGNVKLLKRLGTNVAVETIDVRRRPSWVVHDIDDEPVGVSLHESDLCCELGDALGFRASRGCHDRNSYEPDAFLSGREDA
jgi:hypothetical protein